MINVSNTDIFTAFLTSVSKFVPAAEFNIALDKTDVMALNEEHTVRSFFTTNVCTGDACSFSLNEISKLIKSISLTAAKDVMKLEFDGTFLKHKGKGSFKLKTVKKDVIEKYVSKPIVTQLNTLMSFKMPKTSLRSLQQASAIVSSESAKLYLIVKDGLIFGEIDDKTNTLSDSISIPLVENTSDVTGTLDKLTCLKLSDFLQITSFPSDDYDVKFTDRNVFVVDAKTSQESMFLDMKMILPLLKI